MRQNVWRGLFRFLLIFKLALPLKPTETQCPTWLFHGYQLTLCKGSKKQAHYAGMSAASTHPVPEPRWLCRLQGSVGMLEICILNPAAYDTITCGSCPRRPTCLGTDRRGLCKILKNQPLWPTQGHAAITILITQRVLAARGKCGYRGLLVHLAKSVKDLLECSHQITGLVWLSADLKGSYNEKNIGYVE